MSILTAQRPRVAVALVGAALAATASLAPVSAGAVTPNLPSSPLLLAGPGSVRSLGTDGVLSSVTGLLDSLLQGSSPVLSQDTLGNVLTGRGDLLTTLAPDGTQSQTTVPGVSDIVGLASGNGATYVLDRTGLTTKVFKLTSGGTPQLIPDLSPGSDYTAIANDALGNVVLADQAGRISQILASGGTAPAPISTGLTAITGLAENAGTIFALNGGLTPTVTKLLAGGGVSQVPSPDPLSSVKAISVDPSGNLYLALAPLLGLGSTVYELPTGSITAVPMVLDLLPTAVTNMISYTPSSSQVVPPPTSTTPGTNQPGSAGYPAATFRVRTTVRHVRRHHARITASGLMAGETYTVRLRNRVIARGTASSTGTIRITPKIPRCFHGKGVVKVTGATSSRTGTSRLKVAHRPAGCHR